jgi:hypothetical protein
VLTEIGGFGCSCHTLDWNISIKELPMGMWEGLRFSGKHKDPRTTMLLGPTEEESDSEHRRADSDFVLSCKLRGVAHVITGR